MILRLALEFGAYPVWCCDDEGNCVNDLPEEWQDDGELLSLLDRIQSTYESLFRDNSFELCYIGFDRPEQEDAFDALLQEAVDRMEEKNDGRYEIINDADYGEPET